MNVRSSICPSAHQAALFRIHSGIEISLFESPILSITIGIEVLARSLPFRFSKFR
jgi:hypothetical protein